MVLITFTVGADAIANYNGPALTAPTTGYRKQRQRPCRELSKPVQPGDVDPVSVSKRCGCHVDYPCLGWAASAAFWRWGGKTAGTYYSRSRAAYWNGKNEFGEPVASGVYFYTLTAGDFSAMRKMLIRK